MERAVSLGQLAETKTRRRRTVRLLAPLAGDLGVWRQRKHRAGDALIFPRRDGHPWRKTDYQNWRRRIYIPAGEAAGVELARPYDLRHSFVSLLIAEGQSVVEVARQAGHSPKVALDTYAHVFEEADRAERLGADARIMRARSEIAALGMQPTLFDSL